MHKPVDERASPFPGRIYPTGSVTGMPSSSDWPVIGPDGNSRIEAHSTIEAEVGALIYVHNRGRRISSREALEAVRSGNARPDGAVYMRTAPVFDALNGPHQWLHERLFIASLWPSLPVASIDVFVVDWGKGSTSICRIGAGICGRLRICKGFLSDMNRSRLRSFVRPVCSVHVTAGPYEVRSPKEHGRFVAMVFGRTWRRIVFLLDFGANSPIFGCGPTPNDFGTE